MEATIYRLVQIGRYDQEQIERMDADFAAGLLRAYAGEQEALRWQQEQEIAGAKNRSG